VISPSSMAGYLFSKYVTYLWPYHPIC